MKKRLFIALLALVIVLVAIRLYLPTFIKNQVNDVLANLNGYTGHVERIDLHLWRGAYSVHELKIFKTGGKIPVPFVHVPRTDLSIFWRQILKLSLVGEVKVTNPDINFVNGINPQTTQTGKEQDWLSLIKKSFPLRIDRFEVIDGKLHYRDFYAKREIDIYIAQINALARNLTNSEKISKSLVATITANGKIMQQGPVEMELALDPFAKFSSFDFKGKIQQLDLTRINPLTREYGKFDFEKGTLDVVSEITATNGKFRGYLKPLFHHVDILDLEKDSKKDHDNIFILIWEGIVGATENILKHQRKDQFATKIPLEGDFTDPKTNTFEAAINIFRNGFVKAFKPVYESNSKKK